MRNKINALLAGTFAAVIMSAAIALAVGNNAPHYDSPGGGGGGGASFASSGTLDSNINLTVQGTGDIILPSGTRVNDDVGDGTISFEDSGGDGYGFFHTAGSNTVTLQDEGGVNNPNMTVPGNLSSNAFVYSKTGKARPSTSARAAILFIFSPAAGPAIWPLFVPL